MFLKLKLKPNFFLKCFFSSEKENTNYQETIISEHKKAVKLIESKSYKEALSIYSELIENNPNLKGSSPFNNLLDCQAQCFFFLRDYSEAENNYMNIIEYIKFSLKNKTVDFTKSGYFHYYLKMLGVFIYSGSEKVGFFSFFLHKLIKK